MRTQGWFGRIGVVVIAEVVLACGPGRPPAAGEPGITIGATPAVPDAGAPAPAPVEPSVVPYTPRHTRPFVVLPAATSPAPAPRAPRGVPGVGIAGPMVEAYTPHVVRDDQIKLLEDLLAATADTDAEKPDLLFRIAEAQAQRAYYARLRGMELQVKIAQGQGTPALATERKKWADQDTARLGEAVKWYAELTSNVHFVRYPRLDGALFFMASAQQRQQQMGEARKTYQRLIKDYPASKYIPDAYLAFADHYFDQGQFDDAGTFYDKVMQFPKSAVFAYAVLKRGHVRFNQGDFPGAMAEFFKAHQAAGTRQPEVAREARSGFVLAYAEVGKADKARLAFKRVSAADADAMLEELVNLYDAAGKGAQAVWVYRELISLRSGDAKVCDWELGVVRALLLIGTAEDRAAEVGTLLTLADRVKTPACSERARGLAGDLAHAWHAEGQKTLDVSTLERADRIYTRYLTSFPTGVESAAIRLDHAELLWQLADRDRNARTARAKWERAAAAFDAAATDPAAPPDRQAAAGEAARLARDNLAAMP